jgi:hypothetical protein
MMEYDPYEEQSERQPFSVLRAADITPTSTIQQVQNASFLLMASGGMSEAQRAAWDDLRLVPRRLAAEFLLYGAFAGEENAHD